MTDSKTEDLVAEAGEIAEVKYECKCWNPSFEENFPAV